MNERLSAAVAAVVAKGRMNLSPAATAREGSGGGRIARIRDRHHTIARMVSSDMPDDRICSIMGMTQQSLDLLRDHTPAFQELVFQYRQKPNRQINVEEYLETKHRIAIQAQLALADRLAEDPDDFSPSELVRIIADNDDRTGYAKQTVNINVHEELGERLEARRRRRASLAGAEAGGGALSATSAPPLLELKAEVSRPSPGPEVAIPLANDSPPARSPEEMHRHLSAGRSKPVPNVKEFKRRI